MPDVSHLWQRFLLASALIFGLVLGVGATVFGYSNTAPVNLGWSVFHLRGVPLWAVVLVPLALVLVAGTLFHWFNSLHHFTEHMRHRRRVHELEAEVASLRKHLDELLQMPGHPDAPAAVEARSELAPVLPEAVTSNGADRTVKMPAKAAEPVAMAGNGSSDAESESDTEAVSRTVPTAGS